jgi:hypothetical protein
MFSYVAPLYADLANALGVAPLTPDGNGTVSLDISEDVAISIFAESPNSVMLASAALPLPAAVDYGRALWLLRRNFHDSPIAPFRLACDADGVIVVWGRVPTEGLKGEQLAALIKSLAEEISFIREEVEIEAPTE